MNLRHCVSCCSTASFSATLFCLLLTSAAAKDKVSTPPPNSPATVSPAGNQTAFIAPESRFVLPQTPAEGKDPFFPESLRPYPAPPAPAVTNRLQAPTPAPVTVAADLRLQGISGPPQRRLAIINTRTFAVGEEEDVPTSTGRARVRCLEINADSVVVQVGQQRRELRPRSGF
jgi:hypothetical protein